MAGLPNPSRKLARSVVIAIFGFFLIIGATVVVVAAPGQPSRLLARPLPKEKLRPAIVPTESHPHEVTFRARSGRVEKGTPYRFRMYTHCGLDGVIDFDGSLWDFAGPGKPDEGSGNPPAGFNNPEDHGIMTLMSKDKAEYESSQGVVVRYQRRDGLKQVPMCM